jgi:hypothetical protein
MTARLSVVPKSPLTEAEREASLAEFLRVFMYRRDLTADQREALWRYRSAAPRVFHLAQTIGRPRDRRRRRDR